jgi:2-oxoisovalerate dehydrogenase E1 component
MLRTCLAEAHNHGRVVVFVEPIALYMTRDLHKEGDKEWAGVYPPLNEKIELGEFGIYHGENPEKVKTNGHSSGNQNAGAHNDQLIITYGNGYFYSRRADKILRSEHNIKSSIIDLRWVAPLNMAKLCSEARKFKRVLIVEECRKTGSFSEQIAAGLVENLYPCPQIKIVAADDCFIPLGVAAASGLPNEDKIISASLSFNSKIDVREISDMRI